VSSAPLIVELVVEELPPKALKKLGEAFAESLLAGLRRRDFVASDARMTAYATPRRLAVLVTDVRSIAPDAEVVDKLMPAKVARDASGHVTEALKKKLAGVGRGHLATDSLDASDGPDAIYVASDGKADYVYLRSLAKGQPLQRGLEEALAEAIEKLPIPKVMSYAGPGSYFNDEKFVRPAHSLLVLHGANDVKIGALGLTAGRTTAGHRFLSRADIAVATAGAYEETLRAEGKVVASFAERRAQIVAALGKAADGATVIMPDALLDEVTALVEWPAVFAGTFDADFLAVPQECLILTMQANQRYFALADQRGRLIDRFLLVANLDPSDPSAIVQGNERVLRARLADAKFFYDHDRRQPLATRVEKLRGVVYHAKLGTQFDRARRIGNIAVEIVGRLGADRTEARRAADLSKADLVTDMVGEFPELQGVMGRYYAQHDGEPAAVADAIEQHYWPRFSGDRLPESPVAQAVALADKLEALTGLFGVGQIPTGEKDPFGLRRAALGVIRIVVENHLALSLSYLLELGFNAFENLPAVKDARPALASFIYDRLRGHLREEGYTANQIAAVVDDAPPDIHLVPARLAAVQSFEALPESSALAAANKRIVNILRKSESEAAPAVDRSRLESGAEHDLWLAFQKLEPAVDADCGRGDFTSALKALATAKPAVDRFFDDVMVMADDPAIRANRLALLRGIATTMNRVADISKLAV
jgi:glycyl-tRNA synthetase beta chain